MHEIHRENDVAVDPVFRTNCLTCGEVVDLWYNGGELDWKECCGLFYRLEAPKINFVVEAK